MMIKSKLFLNRLFRCYRVLALILGGISMLIALFIARVECRQCFVNKKKIDTPPITKTFAVYQHICRKKELTDVYEVLESMGYRNNQTPGDDWDLVWVADDPYDDIHEDLEKMEIYQKVSRIPGSGNFTNKVELATSGLPFIPIAFRLPQQKAEFLEYSQTQPFATFIQKSTGLTKIGTISNMDLNKEDSCAQVFIENPLLITAQKFEIGIYAIVTSIDPLRVYIYNGDADIRFAPKIQYPIGPSQKSALDDCYIPLFQLPALEYYFIHLGFGMKDSLNIYLRSQGKDPSTIWTQIEESIRILLLDKEPFMATALKNFKHKSNFFEMVRFDFIVSDELKVYLLKITKRPNLSSVRYPRNIMLNQQLLYNVFGLIGMGETHFKNTLISYNEEDEMIVADKQLVTYPEICSSNLCENSCAYPDCQLCKPCLSLRTRQNLVEAFKEHLNSGDCKRLFPPLESKEEATKPISGNYSVENELHYRWFKGKCLLDNTWCSS